MPRDYDRPTSEWTYSHALAEGDELIDTKQDLEITVTSVNDNGSIDVDIWINGRYEGDALSRTWREGAVTEGLSNGTIETVDGLSHELASF